LSFDVGEGQIVNIAAWRFFDRDQNLDSDFSSDNGTDVNSNDSSFDQFSNELRYVLPAEGDLTGQFGLFYFKSQYDQDSVLLVNDGPPSFPFCVGAVAEPGPPPACNVSNDAFLGRDALISLDTESMAAFGQVDYRVNDEALVFVGARLTRDELDLDLVNNRGNYFVNLATPGEVVESTSNTNFSFKVGGQYDLADNAMIFASYGEGYKAPGFNDGNIPGLSLTVEEETSETIEIGIRSQFLDNRLTANATFFMTDFDNYQAQSFSPAAESFIIQNAATVEAQGLELDLSLAATEDLTLNWTASFLDSVFGDFPGVECYPGQTEPASCGTDGTFNAEGLNTPVSAELTSTVQGVYEFAVGENMDGFVEANWYYRSEINYSQNGAPDTELDAVNVYGLSAGVMTENGWRFSIFCRNCTDEKMPTAISLAPGDANDGISTAVQTWGFNSVRSIGATVSYEF
jgi:iron complex outermembrane receptor protein